MSRQIGVPVVWPSYTPDRISTVSGSLRCVTWRDVPGRRRSSSGWMSASDSVIPGGQPSITQPMAGPCDSPKLVTWKRWPKVLPDMQRFYGPSTRRRRLLVARLVDRPVADVRLQHAVLEVL